MRRARLYGPAVMVLTLLGCRRDADEPTVAEAQEARRAVVTPGSRVRLSLPKSITRRGRGLRYAGDNPHVVLDVTEGAADGRAGLELTMESLPGPLGFQRTGSVQWQQRRDTLRALAVGQKANSAGSKDGSRPARILAMANGDAMALIIASAEADGVSTLDRVLDSAELIADTPLDLLRLHGVSMAVARGFVVRTEVSNPTHITQANAPIPVPPDRPVLLIQVAQLPERLLPLESAIAAMLKGLSGHGIGAEDITFKGRTLPDGQAVEASAQGEAMGVPSAFYVLGERDQFGTLIVVARSPKAEASRYMPVLRAMVESIRLAAPPQP